MIMRKEPKMMMEMEMEMEMKVGGWSILVLKAEHLRRVGMSTWQTLRTMCWAWTTNANFAIFGCYRRYRRNACRF